MITEDRKKELASMSDAWLREMLGLHSKQVEELKWEFNRRFPSPEKKNKLVELPCTLQELETAVHGYGDHNGFHGKVDIVLDNLVDPEAYNYLSVYEGDGK